MTDSSSRRAGPVSSVHAVEFTGGENGSAGETAVERLAALLFGHTRLDGVLSGLKPNTARMTVRSGVDTAIGTGFYDLEQLIWHVDPGEQQEEWLQFSLCSTAERTVLVRGRRTVIPAGQLMVSSSTVAHTIVHGGRNEWWAFKIGAASVHLPRRRLDELLFRPHPLNEFLAGLVRNTLPAADAPDNAEPVDAAGFDLYLIGLAEVLLRSMTAGSGGGAAGSTRRQDVERFILRNLTDPGLSVNTIAAAHSVSRRRLYQLFESSDIGVGVAEFIRQTRMERARELLADPALRGESVANIAARCGFVSPAHFTRLFRDTNGMPPGEYRRRKLSDG